MSAPRLSIIPAGAVFDRSLEGRDLQVLCLLGIHTNKLGWCFRSQVEMARELGCGRSSVQRSLERLYDSDWVEKRLRSRGGVVVNPARPHAAHAYRVKLDRQDIKFDLLDDGVELEDQIDGAKGCPPVGTGVPTVVGTGCPRMHGHMNDDSNESVVVGVSESKSLVSVEAIAIAEKVAIIAGIDPENPPASWAGSGPAMRVQAFLNEGYRCEHLIAGAERAMAGKRDGPPRSIEYFRDPWALAKGRAEAPVPKGAAQQSTKADRTERMADAKKYLDDLAGGRPVTNE